MSIDEILKYLTDNASWVFSGVGVVVLVGLVKVLFAKKANGQVQTVSGNGRAFQAGRDIKINEKPKND
ncbi:hypothetical protein LU646_11785 [Pseudomonas alloputida]|uniref:hypothetical protein n=1 Tax=Pseudomonas alloputida TaxID=1940621 RepID=UPI001E413E83|nr:hypothetical protein [Pseudomonas alloputida]MCE1058557.1 hypothetical protein [Pseudomonas alloputida]